MSLTSSTLLYLPNFALEIHSEPWKRIILRLKTLDAWNLELMDVSRLQNSFPSILTRSKISVPLCPIAWIRLFACFIDIFLKKHFTAIVENKWQKDTNRTVNSIRMLGFYFQSAGDADNDSWKTTHFAKIRLNYRSFCPIKYSWNISMYAMTKHLCVCWVLVCLSFWQIGCYQRFT